MYELTAEKNSSQDLHGAISLTRLRRPGLKVLIASQLPSLSDKLRRLFLAAGFKYVRVIDSVTDAIDAVKANHPCLVLLDAEFVGQAILLATIRSDEKLSSSPVIMFNRSDDEGAGICITDVQTESTDWNEEIVRIREAIEVSSACTNDHSGENAPQPRREPRFTVLDSAALDSSIELEIGDEPCQVPVSLIDISRHGAKFTTKLPPTVGTSITLQVATSKADVEIKVRGEVRWCEPRSDKQCCVGCFFPDELQVDSLHRLATAGLLERRASVRIKTKLDVTIKEQLSIGKAEPATIVDYSTDGLRLIVTQPKQVGQRIMVQLHRAHRESGEITVRTVWQNEVDEGFAVGCCFVGKGAHEQIQQSVLADELKVGNDTPPAKLDTSLRMSGIWWVGLVTIIALVSIATIPTLEPILIWCDSFLKSTVFPEIGINR